MDAEQLKAYLETDEGKAFLEEHKKPLINKRDELLNEIRTTKEKAKLYEELGDVETLKSIVEEHKKAKDKLKTTEEESFRKNGNFEALEKNLRQELAGKEESISKFKQKAIDSKLNAELTSAIVEAKGVSELLKPVLANRVKASFNDEGEIVTEVFDEAGKPFYVNGGPATIKDLIESLKSNEIYGRAFEGTGASGSGTRQSSGKTSGGVILDKNDPAYSVSAAMAYYKKNPQAMKK